MKKPLVALLPLKANSERVPGKNFRLFNGRPLFKWILENLLESSEISKIVINTDAQEELKQAGLDDSNPRIVIRTRREDLCGDHVSMNRIIDDDLKNTSEDHYLMTHVTNPLISTATITSAIEQFWKKKQEGFDSLFSVNSFQSRFYWKNNTPVNHDPSQLIRTQDLDPLYEENSCLYIFSRQSFQATNARIGTNPYMMPTPSFESVDIDTEENWKMAELFSKYYF